MKVASILVGLAIVIAFWIGYQTDPGQFLPLAMTVIIALGGWLFGHQFTKERDRINKQREIRMEYLMKAYRLLADASMRVPEKGSQYFRDMESAMQDIQLFGTASQVKAAQTFMDEFSEKCIASMDTILRILRDDLRKDMGSSAVDTDIKWFRPEGVPKEIVLARAEEME